MGPRDRQQAVTGPGSRPDGFGELRLDGVGRRFAGKDALVGLDLTIRAGEFIDKAIALSAEQNHGSAALSRLCKPELKTCVMAVAYLLKDGRQGLATVIQSAEGNITRREVCESNVSNDLRYCIDWDTGAKYRDVKNTKGDWVQTIE